MKDVNFCDDNKHVMQNDSSSMDVVRKWMQDAAPLFSSNVFHIGGSNVTIGNGVGWPISLTDFNLYLPYSE